MKVRAILNPTAGLAARRALRALESPGPAFAGLEVAITSAAGHGRQLAAQAVEEGCDLVLAVGGDGTSNEVAGGLLGSNCLLGVVPMGSGNGLARMLRVPLEPRAALLALAQAVPRTMDIGLANGRPFLNVAGAGFDAAVGAEFHAWGLAGGRRGILPYVRIAARRALQYRCRRWRLEGPGVAFEGPALLVSFLNGRQYGGAAVIAPGARLDDGLLDVVVIEEAGLAELMFNAPRLFLGGLEGFRRYRLFPATGAMLTSADGPFEHHRDGDPEPAADALTVSLRPAALRVLVPRATAEDPLGPFGAPATR